MLVKIFKMLKNVEVIYINGLFSESSMAAFLRKKPFVVRIAGDQAWERAIRKKWTDTNFSDFQKDKGNIQIRLLSFWTSLSLLSLIISS